MSDEVVDPRKALEKQCAAKSKCVKLLKHYNDCAQRVAEDKTGSKHCARYYLDYWE